MLFFLVVSLAALVISNAVVLAEFVGFSLGVILLVAKAGAFRL